MKYATNLDLNQLELQNAKIQNLTSAPSSPTKGQIYYNSNVNHYFVYNGTTWDQLDNQVNVSVTSPITNTGTALAPIIGHATSGVGAGTYFKTTVDINGHVTGGSNPTTLSGFGITDAASSGHNHTSLSTQVADLNMGGKKVINIASASANTDAVNLGQVNTLISNATSGSSSSLHIPVPDLTTAKAIAAADRLDKMLLNIEALGLYRYDAESTAASNDNTVIRPTDLADDTVAGRWIKMSSSINDHNNLDNMQGGTTGQYYHLTSAQVNLVNNASQAGHTHTSANITDATNANTANMIVKRDGSGNFSAGTITAALSGNATTATTLQTARTIGISGDGTGTAQSFNGSANITIPFTLANVATAGTYFKTTINAKGLVTSGSNPTTLAGFGITDATPFATQTAATAATAGWYRIAQSAVNIGANAGLFKVDFSGTGVRGSALFRASCHDGVNTGTNINQVGFSSSSLSLGVTQARVVYHTTATANYAYVEVYNPTALALTLAVDLIDSTGWSLVTPSTAGSIPTGYTSESLTFDVGIVSGEDITATGVLRSNIATGTAPLAVTSTTLVSNLNADLHDGMHAVSTNTVSSIVSRDSSGNFSAGTITATLSGNASTATKWQTGRTIALTGDITGTSGAFDGSGNLSFATTLASVGTAGTYCKVTTDTKGRVTSGTTLSASDIPTAVQAKRYAADVPAGTSVAITHSLGTTDVIVQVKEKATNTVIQSDIVTTDANTVTLGFASNGTAGTYRVVVLA